jgi:glycerophosphoryl diester phosphodiesterase
VLCGHRGSGRGEVAGQRENTLGSFRAAVDLGLGWVEMDARLNAGGELVCFHDPAVDGRLVSSLATEETDALGIARVGSLLAELPASVGIDLEIKTSLEDARRPRAETTAARVAALVEESPSRPLLVSSFDPSALLIFRELVPDVPVGLLTWAHFPLRKAIPATVHLGAQVVAPHVSSLVLGALERSPSEYVSMAHEAALEVLVWNSRPEERAGLIAAGVDCLVIDDVPGALASPAA